MMTTHCGRPAPGAAARSSTGSFAMHPRRPPGERHGPRARRRGNVGDDAPPTAVVPCADPDPQATSIGGIPGATRVAPDDAKFTIYFPLALWIVVGAGSVARFLSYLDLRIRREGWEVELLMRAEEANLTRSSNLGFAGRKKPADRL